MVIVFHRFFCIILTPVLAGVLFFPTIANAWSEAGHVRPNYFSINTLGGHMGLSQGYKSYYRTNSGHAFYGAELYSAKPITILSRAGFTKDLDKESFVQNYYVELGMPVTMDIFSYSTRVYLYYENNRTNYELKTKKQIDYIDGPKSPGTYVSMRTESHMAAIFIDTPITNNDSPDSISRFGIYYNEDDAPGVLEIGDTHYIIDLKNSHFGVMYLLSKAVFFDNFIVDINLKAGLGRRTIPGNIYDFTRGDFKDSIATVNLGAALGLAYNINIVEHVGLQVFGKYQYNSITTLLAPKDGKPKIYDTNKGLYQVGVKLALSF